MQRQGKNETNKLKKYKSHTKAKSQT